MNDSPYHRQSGVTAMNRRDFLFTSGGGLGGIALASLLGHERLLAATPTSGVLHAPAKAKRVVQLFMAGAASHVDMWDYKPLLEKKHGEKWDPGEAVELFQSSPGSTFASPWKFKPYGKSGKMLSDIVAPIGDVVDDIAFVHNVVGRSGVHSQATLLQSTGFLIPGYPSMGAWVSYGLGSLNDNLPTFVVLPDIRGLPSNGQKNWDSAFLPGQNQATQVRVNAPKPIDNLAPPPADYITPSGETEGLQLLDKLNRTHVDSRPGDPRLEARIRSYELAAKMQLAAPDALDLSKESEKTLTRYGIDNSTKVWPKEINVAEEQDAFGRKCLTARRLLERGVRFVQIWSGNDNGFPRRNWDSHEDIARDHAPLSLGMAKGTAALIQDLKDRGMFEDTLILWTTEFGRMPCAQGGKGRDHNPFVFTNWLAGGGIKGGVTHGQSDEWGFKPADRKRFTQGYDIHATVLHLLGLDHEKLTFRHNGANRRLTDVHGHVIKEILS